MRKLLTVFFVLFAVISTVYGQSRTVTGVVTSEEDGLPLPQLTVLLKGSTTGVVTNMDGQYSISVPGPESELVFKYTGYETQTIKVGAQSTINVVMKSALEEIDQVVVMGYGSAKKVGSTVGNASIVKSAELQNIPVADVNIALAGKVPGLTVMGGSSRPGETQKIMMHGAGSIKGSTTPLYVLDGQPISARDVKFLNPQDFANVSVLTDASATSIYGSRAANGVVYITTKQGRSGEGHVNVRASYGFSTLSSTKIFDRMMNTEQLLEFQQEVGRMKPAEAQQRLKESDGKSFQWYKYLYREYAPTYQGNVSFSKVYNKTRLYVSGGWYSEQGMESFSDFNRYNFRTNVSSDIKPWLNIGANMNLTYSSTSDKASAKYLLDPSKAVSIAPFFSPYDADGKEKDGIIHKDLGSVYTRKYVDRFVENKGTDYVAIASGFIELTPISGLTVRSQGNAEFIRSGSIELQRAGAEWLGGRGGERAQSGANGLALSITNTAEYRYVLNDLHTFTPLIGQEYRRGFNSSEYISVFDIPNPKLMNLGNGTQTTPPSLGSSDVETWTSSYFGRLEYNYDERYFADASIRRDATSRLAPKHRVNYFWSTGFMWKAKRESFLQDVAWLDNLMLRTSVGTSGNSSIGDFTYFPGVKELGETYKQNKGYTLQDVPANPSLEWEKQLKFTVGVNFSIFRILSGEISYYYRHTWDMIVPTTLPGYTGFARYEANYGAKTNQGVDIRLDVNAYQNEKGDFVTPYLTFNYNRETIDRLGEGEKIYRQGGYSTAYIVGQPVNFYYPRFYRINPDNGKPEWYKPNAEKPELTRADESDITQKYSMALAQPINKPFYAPINGGFGVSASYWGFFMMADFTYSLNKWMINALEKTVGNPMNGAKTNTYSKDLIGNYWKKPGDNAKYPSIKEATWVHSDDRILENASFLRMSHLTVGYAVPQRWLEKTKFFTKGKVFCSMRNLFTVTKFRGADPGVFAANGETTAYRPATRQVTFGIEFEF